LGRSQISAKWGENNVETRHAMSLRIIFNPIPPIWRFLNKKAGNIVPTYYFCFQSTNSIGLQNFCFEVQLWILGKTFNHQFMNIGMKIDASKSKMVLRVLNINPPKTNPPKNSISANKAT
jgi:hypothetical protein